MVLEINRSVETSGEKNLQCIRKLPRVQVLLATCNSMKFLPEQLFSILNQKHIEVNLLCSDDRSSDGTYEYLIEMAQQHKNIQVLAGFENFGSAGKNFYNLILNANFTDYEYIALADHDDIWIEDKLVSATKLLQETKTIAYSSSFIAFWNNGKKRYVNKAGRKVKYDFIFSSPGPGCTFVIDSRIMMRFRDYFLDHKIGNEIYFHDWLIYAWTKTMYPDGWIIDRRALILYRQHLTNVFGVNNGIKAIKKRIGLITNRWYNEEIEKILLFLIDTEYYDHIFELFRSNRLNFAIQSFQMRRKITESFAMFFLILFNFLDYKKIKVNCKK